MRVAISRDDFENSIVQLENRDIERAATQIVNGDNAVLLLVEPVSQRRGGRFVDQAQHFQSRYAARIFRGLPLSIVEVGRNRDDGLGQRGAEKAFRVALELAKDERGDLRRRKSLVAQRDSQHFAGLQIFGQAEREQLHFFLDILDAAPHQSLDGVNRSLRRVDEILARGVSDDRLIVFIQRDDGRDQVRSVLSRDYYRDLPLHEGHEGIRGSEVYSDDVFGCHVQKCRLQKSECKISSRGFSNLTSYFSSLHSSSAAFTSRTRLRM